MHYGFKGGIINYKPKLDKNTCHGPCCSSSYSAAFSQPTHSDSYSASGLGSGLGREGGAKFEEMRSALHWAGKEAVALKEKRLNREEK